MTDRNIRWIIFCTILSFAIIITALAVGAAVRQGVRDEERTMAIKDMADAMDVVCKTTDTLPQAYACIGGLQVMLETIDIKRKRQGQP